MSHRVLLLGCGAARRRMVEVDGRRDYSNCELVSLDINPDHKPDVVHDLNAVPWPFEDNSFDEINAWEVLEHIGQQGDYEGFFAHFYEAWRILKPGGVLAATVPKWDSEWAWADPSHRRVITPGSLTFLSQEEHKKQVGVTAMSDFRFCWQGDFRAVFTQYVGNHFVFALKAVK